MVIVLSVIKIAAVVLLVLALAFAAVLLVPVFYTFDGDTESKSCRFCVNWFFRLIRFRFQFRGKAEAVLKILFFRLDFTDPEKIEKRKKRKAEKAEKKKKKKRRKAARQRQSAERKRAENRGEKPREESSGAEESPNTAGRTNPGHESESGVHEADGSTDAEEKQKAGLLEKASKALPILKAVREYDLPEAVMPALQVLLYRIRPRKLQGYAEFGFADPAYTGQLLGAISMVPFLFGTDFTITPDFEAKKNHVEGKISVQGRIQVIFLMIFLIRMIADKRVRGFLSALRRQRKKK